MPVRLEITPDDYEDGVAAILEERLQGHGSVERNARLPSRSIDGRTRQIDVLIRLPVPGSDDALMVVDCKRYGTNVDVKDVEAFIGLVNDVGAPLGLLVTTNGFSPLAEERAKLERGIRVEVIPVEDLPTWEPPLLSCPVCEESVPEDSMPGMAYMDQLVDIDLEGGDPVEVVIGVCERCATVFFECPTCSTTNTVYEMRTGEWLECDGGCGVAYYLRREMTKDDLTNPTYDRLTLRQIFMDA